MPFNKKEYMEKYNKEYHLKNKERKKEYNKKYRLENKEYVEKYNKEYYLKNKEHIKEDHLKNKEKIKECSKEWRLKNKEHIKEYFLKNKEKIKEHKKLWAREKRRTDPVWRLIRSQRERINHALNGIVKSKTTMELIGCTINELWKHLEFKFQPGMTRQNHGKWHVDHIMP